MLKCLDCGKEQPTMQSVTRIEKTGMTSVVLCEECIRKSGKEVLIHEPSTS